MDPDTVLALGPPDTGQKHPRCLVQCPHGLVGVMPTRETALPSVRNPTRCRRDPSRLDGILRFWDFHGPIQRFLVSWPCPTGIFLKNFKFMSPQKKNVIL